MTATKDFSLEEIEAMVIELNKSLSIANKQGNEQLIGIYTRSLSRLEFKRIEMGEKKNTVDSPESERVAEQNSEVRNKPEYGTDTYIVGTDFYPDTPIDSYIPQSVAARRTVRYYFESPDTDIVQFDRINNSILSLLRSWHRLANKTDDHKKIIKATLYDRCSAMNNFIDARAKEGFLGNDLTYNEALKCRTYSVGEDKVRYSFDFEKNCEIFNL